jgi:hypothetical protein
MVVGVLCLIAILWLISFSRARKSSVVPSFSFQSDKKEQWFGIVCTGVLTIIVLCSQNAQSHGSWVHSWQSRPRHKPLRSKNGVLSFEYGLWLHTHSAILCGGTVCGHQSLRKSSNSWVQNNDIKKLNKLNVLKLPWHWTHRLNCHSSVGPVMTTKVKCWKMSIPLNEVHTRGSPNLNEPRRKESKNISISHPSWGFAPNTLPLLFSQYQAQVGANMMEWA